MYRLIFLATFLFPSILNAQSMQLKLSPSIDTSGIIDLFDLQDKSLDELEASWNMMQTKISALESLNQELSSQLEDSTKLTQDLQLSLSLAKEENCKQAEYQKELQQRLAEANRLHRSATIAGIISGVALGAGVSLTVGGAVKQNMPVLYSGLGVSAAAIIIWTTGRVCRWW